MDPLPHLLQAVHEYIPETAPLKLRDPVVQDMVRCFGVHDELKPDRLFIADDDRLHALIVFPVFLVGKIFLFELSCSEFAVTLPGRALLEDLPDPLSSYGRVQRAAKQHLVHDTASQRHLARGLHIHFLAAHDVGEIRRRGSHVYDQHRLGQNIVPYLEVLGLAGAHQGGP